MGASPFMFITPPSEDGSAAETLRHRSNTEQEDTMSVFAWLLLLTVVYVVCSVVGSAVRAEIGKCDVQYPIDRYLDLTLFCEENEDVGGSEQ